MNFGIAYSQRMRSAGKRHLPVVDERGGLQGVVTLDDVIELLADELSRVAKLLAREQTWEQTSRVSRK